MRLETARLVIRSCVPADAPALLEILSDPEVRKYLPTNAPPTLERIEAGIERRMGMERDHGHALWAVERKDTGELIGQCGLVLVDGTGPEVEIAYHYGRRAWNQGFGTEAAIACLAEGLGPLGLERIVAFALPPNVGSWRIMEKAGMRYDRTVDLYGLTGLKKYVADRSTWAAPA